MGAMSVHPRGLQGGLRNCTASIQLPTICGLGQVKESMTVSIIITTILTYVYDSAIPPTALGEDLRSLNLKKTKNCLEK